MSLERSAFILSGKFSVPKKQIKEEILQNGGALVRCKDSKVMTFNL